MRLSSPFSRYHIDWPNHIIGFLSALFGILIAFELEEWRERKNEQEVAQSAFENLRNEVAINKNVLHENVKSNLKAIATLRGVLQRIDRNLIFTGMPAEADSINRNFSNLIFLELTDPIPSSAHNPFHFAAHITLKNITIPSLQSAAWESAKATGALNHMGYEKVTSLSFVYNHATIDDELRRIRELWRDSGNVTSKVMLTTLLEEMEQSHQVIERELVEYDQFVNMLEAME